MNINDQPLIDAILAGDTQSFNVIVDRYKDLVFTLALRILKHREEAEEASQDTFIKVFRSLNRFKGDSKLSTWIYKVAYFTCLDRLKKQKREQHIVAIDEFTEHQVKTIDNALDMMEKEERKVAIQDCLQLLPSNDVALLTLFYFEELSLEEIAKIVDLTANNVKVKLYRSRKKLASIVRDRIEPEILEYYERDGK
ncbi:MULTISPECIES: RNA polymerase sigma factor [Maribacter]|uniref:RNA polymerase sigma factor n=1 Tax=Maribacter TaxID=252356 RepID=UPI00249289EB|nr:MULTISPECIES: RNA polymerase sigma factor [Maribacter]WRI29365.1 RNA polymerase sigma factor [Maribacter sp. BPC-D8]